MNKIFNVSAICFPEDHYMVNIDERLKATKTLVDEGKYFTINRARQYGKSTILMALADNLEEDYYVVFMDFQKFGSEQFKTENLFAKSFAASFLTFLSRNHPYKADHLQAAVEQLELKLREEQENFMLQMLFEELSNICASSDKPIVLMIDEVDNASNNQVFLDFLSQLRGYYITKKKIPAFHSVILASVYDIKNIKYKLHPDHMGNSGYPGNSPWNIAADFLVDMDFSVKDIAGMLSEYESDYRTEMDIWAISSLIYDYTSGYPFLVSRICKLIDERIAGSSKYPDRRTAWTKNGVLEAVRILLVERNTLFESLTGKLAGHPELRNLIYFLLFSGSRIPYNPLNQPIDIAEMFGFIKNSDGNTVISNRIFETLLYNLFLSEEMLGSQIYDAALLDKNQFVQNGRLNMELVLERFVIHFDNLYGDQKEDFLEEAGRRYFLLYLLPIINGTGNFYVEAQTRNRERTDVIVDYRGEQFVIELKLWRGNAYNERGENQLTDYLDYYHLKKGYMLSYNFNKKKQIGVKRIRIKDKLLIEAVV